MELQGILICNIDVTVRYNAGFQSISENNYFETLDSIYFYFNNLTSYKLLKTPN